MSPKEKLLEEATDVLRKLVPFITDDTVLRQAVDSLMTGEFATCTHQRSDATNPNFLAARIMTWAAYFSEPVGYDTEYESTQNLRVWVKRTKFFLDSHNV